MLKFSHRTLIVLAGLVWLSIGLFLFTFGISLVLDPLHKGELFTRHGFSIIHFFSKFTRSLDHSIVLIFFLALIVGYIKGRWVLSKSVRRQIRRISSYPNPTSIKSLYSPAYYALIGLMMLFGMLLRWLPISPDTRGAIDMAIGAALLNGALSYFRYARQLISTSQGANS